MRTLRLSLAVAVILALLGGLAGVVVAQTEDDGYYATPVTGDFLGMDWDPPPEFERTVLDDGKLERARNLVLERYYEWDDPRLPGTLLMMWDWDEMRLPGTAALATVDWGQATMSDDQGAWTGPFFGAQLGGADAPRVAQYWLDGSGAYEGHYVVLSADTGRGPDFDLTGLIIEGELPTLGGSPAE